MLCLRCVHAKGEIPATPKRLGEIAEEMATRYPVVAFCSIKEVIVVGNPDRPTQIVDECKFFEAG